MNHTTNKKEQIDDIEIVSNMDKFFFFCFFQKSNTKIKITKFRMCNLYYNNICRIKSPNYILDLGPCPKAWVVRGGTNGEERFRLRI